MNTTRITKNCTRATLFALFASMLSTGFTACTDKEDLSMVTTDQTENFAPPPLLPTEDAKTVMISGKTYVFGGNYKGEGKALVDRVVTSASSLQEDGVQNIIIHNSSIPSLTNVMTTDLLRQMSRGAALVVVDPTATNMKVLAKYLHNTIDALSTGGDDEGSRAVANQILGSRITDRILLWNDNFINTIFEDQEGQRKPISTFAIRNEDSYTAYHEPEGETVSAPVQVCDENGNVIEEKTVSYVDNSEMTNYHFGIKADHLAAWLNTPDDDPIAKEASRNVAARMMATRAGGTAEDFLDQITESQEHSVPVGFQLSGPEGHSPYHTCNAKFRIWTAYSTVKKCDIYCVTEEITAYNQMLHCGPTDQKKWYNGKNWAPLDELSKRKDFVSKYVYGPYMSKIKTSCRLVDDDRPVTLEEYAPKNSTTGGVNETNGFNFSLGASVSAKASGPEAGVSASMQWSHSVSKFNADLTVTAAPKPEGKVMWSYTTTNPDAHYGILNNTHETAKSIQTSTCTVEQAWVWTLKGSSSSVVYLKPYITLQDNWLAYSLYTFECRPHYITATNTVMPVLAVSCPPRYLQTWSMNVESDDVSADKREKIEALLASRLSKYFMPTCVFSTVKPNHQKETKDVKRDEVGDFIEDCKSVYTSKTGLEILHEAGERAGLTDADSYTIVWRHTDLGANSDNETFTYHMSMK